MNWKTLYKQDRSRYGRFGRMVRIFLWCFRRVQCGCRGPLGILAKMGVWAFRWVGVGIETKSVGGGLRLPHVNGIYVHENAAIGENCTIFQQVTIGVNEHQGHRKAPQIGNGVYIGAGAKLIGDIRIGADVRIGANAVVTKDVPPEMTVVGYNRVFKNRE